jgi:hypothetical protein
VSYFCPSTYLTEIATFRPKSWMIDKLIQLVRDGFQKVTDSRSTNTSYKLGDILSISFAIFSLKDPSLTFFREQYPVREENLRRIYGLESLPEDTAL